MIALMALGDSARWREIHGHSANAEKAPGDPHTPLERMRLDIPECPQYGPLDDAFRNASTTQTQQPSAPSSTPGATESADSESANLESANLDSVNLDSVNLDSVNLAPSPRVAPRAGNDLQNDRAIEPLAAGDSRPVQIASTAPDNAFRPRQRPSDDAGASSGLTVASLDAAASPPEPTPVVTRPASADSQGATEIEALTGDAFPPFVDQSAPAGGMAAQIIAAAFQASGVSTPLRVDVVGDWSAHMSFLLRDDKFDIGFPWTKPVCDPAPASEADAVRCEYVYSDPFMHVSMEFYGPVDLEPKPSGFDALANAMICRPEGRALDDLLAKGLIPGETIRITRAGSATGCFQMLSRGEVDFVSANRFTAQKAVRDLELASLVAPIPGLSTAQSLHVAAHRDNIEASGPWMDAFNRGLAEIRRTGLFDEIKQWHVMRFRNEM